MKHEKYIKCWVNGRYEDIPLKDYLDIEANKYGYDSYKELREDGFKIDLLQDSVDWFQN